MRRRENVQVDLSISLDFKGVEKWDDCRLIDHIDSSLHK